MLLQFNSMCVLGGTTSYTGQMFCEALFYTSHLIVFSWQISSSTMKVYYSVTQTRYKFTNKPKRVLHCVCSHSVCLFMMFRNVRIFPFFSPLYIYINSQKNFVYKYKSDTYTLCAFCEIFPETSSYLFISIYFQTAFTLYLVVLTLVRAAQKHFTSSV